MNLNLLTLRKHTLEPVAWDQGKAAVLIPLLHDTQVPKELKYQESKDDPDETFHLHRENAYAGFAQLLQKSADDDHSTGYNLLFEVRSENIKQGGDICFPGGHVEEGESPEDAACRETEEELELNRVNGHKICMICPMHVLQGPGGIQVTSFLGELQNYHGSFSKDEISRVFVLPLDWFLEHEPVVAGVTAKTSPDSDFPFDKIPGGRDLKWRDVHRPVYFYDTPEGLIWGLTAEIIWNLMEVIRPRLK